MILTRCVKQFGQEFAGEGGDLVHSSHSLRWDSDGMGFHSAIVLSEIISWCLSENIFPQETQPYCEFINILIDNLL